MDEIERIRTAAAPLMAWWAAHEGAIAKKLPDDQTVMYYRGNVVTAKNMRDLTAALNAAAQPQ